MQEHDDEELSARQRKRQSRNQAARRSAALAHALMGLADQQIKGLELEDGQREAIDRARSVPGHGSRRREERRLAGELRQTDPTALEAQLAALQDKGGSEERLFRRAETWRARMIEEGPTAAAVFHAEFGVLEPKRWPSLVGDAQRHRASGQPTHGARNLFRAIMIVLRANADR